MNVLVTGGAGFIGSHLVNRLIENGIGVVVLDNLSTGKKENLNPKAKFIKGDILEAITINNAIKGCSFVFHLASCIIEDTDVDYKINYLGAKNVFEIAASNNAKVIFASSAAVYGNAKVPHSESMECKPLSQYGKSKLKAEKSLPSTSLIARIFNCYGPLGNGVVNIFCDKISEYKEIKVFGTGMQTRDFVYVSDVVDALMLGIENSGTYNVGNGVETSISDVIDIIHKMSRAKPTVRFELPKNEAQRSRADITKIKSIGWKPKITIDEGIKLTLQSIKAA